MLRFEKNQLPEALVGGAKLPLAWCSGQSLQENPALITNRDERRSE
jgi:hypothetical protein